MILIWLLVGICLGLVALMPALIRGRWQRRELQEDILRLEQEKQIVLGFMHTMVEEVGFGMGREGLRQKIVHTAMSMTGATSACLFEKTDRGTLQGVAIDGLFPPLRAVPEASSMKMSTRVKFIENILRSEEISPGEGVIGTAAIEGRSLFIAEGSRDGRIVHHSDPALTVRSLMVAPLQFRSDLLGVIAVANPSDGHSFGESDFSLLQSLAEQSAMAMHNADLIQAQIERNRLNMDLSLASDVQKLLLPKIYPRRDSLQVATHYFSAQKVGGDLFDLIDLPGERLGFAIADVSGKGMSAGLLMALCQTHLRHLARRYEDPAEVLSAMNRELLQEISREMFITMIYGVIDLRNGHLRLARAGHELPLLFAPQIGGSTDEASPYLRSPGMALAMVEDGIFSQLIETVQTPFDPGTILVLYTDGVTEAINQKEEEFSKERLAEVVRKYRDLDAEGIKEKILEAVERFSGEEGVADDLTLLVIRLCP